MGGAAQWHSDSQNQMFDVTIRELDLVNGLIRFRFNNTPNMKIVPFKEVNRHLLKNPSWDQQEDNFEQLDATAGGAEYHGNTSYNVVLSGGGETPGLIQLDVPSPPAVVQGSPEVGVALPRKGPLLQLPVISTSTNLPVVVQIPQLKVLPPAPVQVHTEAPPPDER